MRRARLLFVVAIASGCGTIWNGTSQTISFSSSPSGAEFEDLRTGERWTAPAVFELERRHSHLLVVSKAGFRDEEVFIHREVSSPWWVVGIATLGVSLFFDSILGGLYDLEPDHVRVALKPDPGATPTPQ